MSRIDALLGDAILFDMTNLCNTPIRTGIQRVTQQLALYWPQGRPILPFRTIAHDQISLLDPIVLVHAERLFSANDDLLQRTYRAIWGHDGRQSDGYHRMLAAARNPLFEIDSVEAAKASRGVLSLELSMNTEFYGRLADEAPDKVFILNYDYILWLNPEFNSEVDWNEHRDISKYISMLRRFPHQSFISTLTRYNYINFVDRAGNKDHPVIRPGTDGLGVTRRDAIGERPEFVVIGTIEPRKQHLAIMRAIEAVQAEGLDVSLTVIGKMGWLVEQDRQDFLRMVELNPGIRWLDSPSDEELKAALGKARASIFFSRTEGFGGPPVESLSLGVPIIVSDTTPSTLDLPDRGQVRVSPDDHAGLRAAIRFYHDPDNARRKQAEIDELTLPTWQSFIVGISDWIDSIVPLTPRPFSIERRIDALALVEQAGVDASLPELFRALFRVATGREASEPEMAIWLGWAEQCGLRGAALIVAFVEAAVPNRTEAFALLSILLSNRDDDLRAAAALLPGGPVEWAVVQQAATLLLLPDDRVMADRLYRVIHRRQASSAEVDGIIEALRIGTPRAEIILSAFTSKEFAARFPDTHIGASTVALVSKLGPLTLLAILPDTDNAEFVRACYKHILGRPADPGGESVYVGMLRSGRPRAEIIFAMILSKEAEQRGGDIDIISGLLQHLSPALPSDQREMVDAALGHYHVRLADLCVSLLVTLGQLSSKDRSLASVEALRSQGTGTQVDERAPAPYASVERLRFLADLAVALPVTQFQGAALGNRLRSAAIVQECVERLEETDNQDFVRHAYRLLLGRAPDPGGLEHHLGIVASDRGRIGSLQAFVHSVEFASRCDSPEVQAGVIRGLEDLAAARANIVTG